MKFFSRLLAILSVAALWPCVISASEIVQVNDSRFDGRGLNNPTHLKCTHRLTGDIRDGDKELVQKALEDIRDVAVICLDSEGGSFKEGIELARYFRSHQVITMIEKNATCLSACALAFMGGGYSEMSTRGYRVLWPGGKLGFHAPSIALPDATYSKGNVEQAYATALYDINAALKELTLEKDENGNPIIEVSLLVEMLLTPPGDMLLVETASQAMLWDIDVPTPLNSGDFTTLARRACYNAFYLTYGAPAPDFKHSGFGNLIEESDGETLIIIQYADTDETSLCAISNKNLQYLEVTGPTSNRYWFRSHLHLLAGTTLLESLK